MLVLPTPGNDARADPPNQPNEHTMWPDRRLLDLFKTEFPIVLAPMAGSWMRIS